MTDTPTLMDRLRGYNPPDRTDDSQRQIAQDIKDAADRIERLEAALKEALGYMESSDYPLDVAATRIKASLEQR